MLFPFSKPSHAAQERIPMWREGGPLTLMMKEPRHYLSYNMTSGTITLRSPTRSVTVSIDEIMDALDPRK